MVKITGRIFKSGNSYAIRIPTELIRSEVFHERELIELIATKYKKTNEMREQGFYPRNQFISENPMVAHA